MRRAMQWILGFAALAGAALAQEPAAGKGARVAEQTGPPVLSVTQLELRYYEVRRHDADELASVVGDLLGRRFFVRERGGVTTEPVWNVRSLGQTLLVYDEPENVARILDVCREIDGQEETSDDARVQSFEYRPRYLSAESLFDLLEGRQEHIRTARGTVKRITAVKDRGLVTLRGSAQELRELRALAERFDVPQDQVLLRCYLLRAGEGGRPGDLPEELVANLAKLVPQERFERIGFALLHSSVSPRSEVNLLLGEYEDSVYTLSFRPVAYDAESGLLSVERCKLIETLPAADGVQSQTREVFTTSTVFRGADYTVIGGSGREPVFVVIQVQPR